MTISLKLYHDAEAAFQEVKQQLESYGYKNLFMWFTAYGKTAEFKLQAGEYSDQETVVGKDLQEMADELIRRRQFRLRQNSLQLSAPIVEGTLSQPVLDDEIPF